MTFRAFIAADVSAGPPLNALAADLRDASPSLKVVRSDQLHLTIKFLGDSEDALVPEIIAAIQDATQGVRPFEVRLEGTGAFPNLARMSVIWVGVEGAEPLARIAEALETSLESLGFPQERRPWKAHLTLARVKGDRELDRARRILEDHAYDVFGTSLVDAIVLKKSVLTPEGARYSIVDAVRLMG